MFYRTNFTKKFKSGVNGLKDRAENNLLPVSAFKGHFLTKDLEIKFTSFY